MNTPTISDLRPSPKKKSRGKLLAKFALLLGSLTLTLIVIEAGLHIFDTQPPTATVFSTYFQYSSNTSWRGKPNVACRFKTANFDAFTSHDADGFRRCGLDASFASDVMSSERLVWVLVVRKIFHLLLQPIQLLFPSLVQLPLHLNLFQEV